MFPNQVGCVRLINVQITFMIQQGPMQRLDRFLPCIDGIGITIRSPPFGVVKNGIITIKEFKGHVIIIVVPLMGQKAGGTVLFQNLVNLFTFV